GRLEVVQAELGTPAELAVHQVDGDPVQRLPVALKAAGAAGAPLLVYLDEAPVPAATMGKPVELILVAPAGGWAEQRQALRSAGAVTREPERGRLSGDVQITVA